ncbi:hypothetical protein ACVW0P_002875 [Mucilaginibacter sp. UYNi724]
MGMLLSDYNPISSNHTVGTANKKMNLCLLANLLITSGSNQVELNILYVPLPIFRTITINRPITKPAHNSLTIDVTLGST